MHAQILSTFPSLVLALAIVAGCVAVATLGLFLVRRSVELQTLEAHQEVAGFIIAIVGVIYAVLLALVVVAVWEDFENAHRLAEREAHAVDGLYRVVDALPAGDQAHLRDDIGNYARTVVDEEWPAMQRGHAGARATALVDDLWASLVAVEPQTARETSAYQEALARMYELGETRQDRLLASRRALPNVLWIVLIGGAITTVGFTFFFGVRRLAAQLLMTIVLTLTIGLVLSLIFVMDLPFSGDVSVGPEAMEDVLARLDRQGQ